MGSLDWEDPLEEGTATHPSIPAWEIPWTEEPGRLQPKELDTTEQLNSSDRFQDNHRLFKKMDLTQQ